jgi:clorobiocin biosynthesis protein CloN4
MQAALRLGAAYVPLDPLAPVERNAAIAEDGALAAIVGDEARLAALASVLGARMPARLTLARDGSPPAAEDAQAEDAQAQGAPEQGEQTEGALANGRSAPGTPAGAGARRSGEPFEERLPAPVLDDTALAYVLYTSGSTGAPKGVCISHENALAFIDWAGRLLTPAASDVFGNHAPFHFDLSVLDIYVAFAAGASVAIVSELDAFLPARLTARIRELGISSWYSVPSALVLLLRSGCFFESELGALHTICFAGEPFPLSELAQLRRRAPDCRLFNLYGPTETNVCTCYEVPRRSVPDAAIPIGVAASGDVVWAEREDGARAAAGEVGELLVSGPTVMLGYWGQPPHPRGAPYRTGDLVRVREGGAFEYLGRRDHLVKIRGHRVELGEVEVALGRHPEIAQAVAVVVGAGIDAKLAAAAVSRTGRPVPLLELKAHCAKQLPKHMLVQRVVWLEELPRTANGKLDRKAILRLCQ